MNLLLFLALLVLAGIIIFILQNPAVVVVKFIIWQTQAIPLGLVVLMAACMGASVVLCLYLCKIFRLRRTTVHLEKERDLLQERLLLAENQLRWHESAKKQTAAVAEVMNNPPSDDIIQELVNADYHNS